MVRMSQARRFFPPSFSPRPSTMGVNDELKMMSSAFSIRDAMVQSTINFQCGQLQSAHSHTIRSKFQARFSSTSQRGFSEHAISGCYDSPLLVIRSGELLRCNWDQAGCPCVWAHCTAGEVIRSRRFRFDCKWSNLKKLNRPSFMPQCFFFLQLLTNKLWKFKFSAVSLGQSKPLSLVCISTFDLFEKWKLQIRWPLTLDWTQTKAILVSCPKKVSDEQPHHKDG